MICASTGQDKHTGEKEKPRDLDLEMLPEVDSIALSTPPRVLHVNDYNFPTVEESKRKDDEPKSSDYAVHNTR